METRREPRFNTHELVLVTMLDEPQTKLFGRMVNFSGRGAKLILPRPAPLGGVVKIEWNNTMLLGEICYCGTDGASFAAGVKLEHALYDLAELARLSHRFVTAA